LSQSPPGFIYESNAELSADVRRALRQIRERRQRVSERQGELSQTQRRIRNIEQEQERLRENLRSVDNGSEYGRRLLDKLNEQETQIERLQAERERQQRAVEEAERDLRDYVRGLTVR
jgi:chromosome segregation ATPase